MKKFLLAGVTALALVTALPFASPAFAKDDEDRSIRVHNDTSPKIVHVYMTDIDNGGWGQDLLAGVINPGDSRMIDPGYDKMRGYCKADFKAVLKNGREILNMDVNLCVATDWHVE